MQLHIGKSVCQTGVLVNSGRLYHERYAEKFNGKVGIALNCDWAQPASESAEDKAAADRFLQWYIGIWAHPILHGKNRIERVSNMRIHLSGATCSHFRSVALFFFIRI